MMAKNITQSVHCGSQWKCATPNSETTTRRQKSQKFRLSCWPSRRLLWHTSLKLEVRAHRSTQPSELRHWSPRVASETWRQSRRWLRCKRRLSTMVVDRSLSLTIWQWMSEPFMGGLQCFSVARKTSLKCYNWATNLSRDLMMQRRCKWQTRLDYGMTLKSILHLSKERIEQRGAIAKDVSLDVQIFRPVVR